VKEAPPVILPGKPVQGIDPAQAGSPVESLFYGAGAKR